MTEFKYTTKEKILELVQNIAEAREADKSNLDAIEYLKSQTTLMRIIYSRNSLVHSEFEALPFAEALLHLFENAEEYELCGIIIKTWPELRHEQNPLNKQEVQADMDWRVKNF